nr:hypothetical protein [Borrelia hermsii]
MVGILVGRVEDEVLGEWVEAGALGDRVEAEVLGEWVEALGG